jgi:flagellum-specific peptidoglycan hydrolase FlgJ
MMTAFAEEFIKTENRIGFPADVLLSIAVLESGWFQYETGKFNYMGIKATADEVIKGKAKFVPTRELLSQQDIQRMRVDERSTLKANPSMISNVKGKQWYTCKCWFRSFGSVQEAADHFLKVLGGPRYASAVTKYKRATLTNNGSLVAKDELLMDIQKAGYSTGPAAIEEQKLLRHKELRASMEVAWANYRKDNPTNV